MLRISKHAAYRNRSRKFATEETKKKTATKKYVAKQLNTIIESKFFDSQLSAVSTVSWSGEVVDFCTIAQQTTTAPDTARIGDNVFPTSIDIRMVLSYNSTSVYNVMRFILFRWNQMDSTHGVAPTAGAVLQYTGDVDAVSSPIINDSRGLSTILYDKTFRMDNGSQQQVVVKIHKKLAKKKILFYASTTEGQNKIYGLFISNRSADLPQVQGGWARIRYMDA